MSDHDYSEGHRVFSTECFNRVWGLLDRPDRSADETARMIDAAHASRYHWRERSDAGAHNLAISAWQLSRVYASAGMADMAALYGQESLDLCAANGLSAFLTGYAFEALARGAALVGDVDTGERYIAAARDAAANVADDEERGMLLNDIEAVASI